MLNIKSLSVVLCAGLAFFSYFGWKSYHNSSDTKALQDLQGGRVICSKRLNQTFTSAILADSGSKYLKPGFMADTESCFRKAIDVSSKVSDRSVLKGFTNVAAKAIWLLDEVKSQINSKEGFRPGIIQSRYQLFEKSSQDWDSVYKKASDNLFKDLKWINGVFVAGGILLAMVLFALYWLIKREEKRIEATPESQVNETKTQKLPEYILESQSLDEMPNLRLEGEIENLKPETMLNQQTKEQKSVDIEPPPVPELEDGIDFDIVLSGILGSLSNKVLSSQVAINYPDVEEDYWVAINRDQAYQLLYPILNYCLSATSTYGPKGAAINLELSQIQNNIIFDIKMEKTKLPLSTYRDFNSNVKASQALPVDLMMAKNELKKSPFIVELLREGSGSIVKINMPRGKESSLEASPTKKLVSLYKGKKSDLRI